MFISLRRILTRTTYPRQRCRPTNLASESYRPRDIKESGKSIVKLLPRSEEDVDDEEDSRRVLVDTIARFDRFLRNAGVGGQYKLYDGMISKYAPVSHKLHALDWLIDRASLVRGQAVSDPRRGEVLDVAVKSGWLRGVVVRVDKTSVCIYDRISETTLKNVSFDTLRRPKRGTCVATRLADDVCTEDEYRTFQTWYNAMGPVARRSYARSVLRTYDAATLRDLSDALSSRPRTRVRFLVGGPLTAVEEMLKIGGKALSSRLKDVTMMMGAWTNNKPGSFNLFKNQFNVGADTEAAQAVLTRRLPCGVAYLVPTETCKHPSLKFNPETLETLLPVTGRSPEGNAIIAMYRLWWAIGGKRDMFCFDVNANIAATAAGRSLLKWKFAKAVVDPDGTTVYVREIEQEDGETKDQKETHTFLCADSEVSERFAERHFEVFKKTFVRSDGGT